MSVVYTLKDQKEIATRILAGQIGVVPTDTVYGLVCAADNPTAVATLYSLKRREMKPGTIIAADVNQLVNLGIKARYLKAVEQYWPNAISIVIPSYELAYIHQGVGSIAVRIPAVTEVHDMLMQTGPLLTTSANEPGKPEAKTIAEAHAYFGDKIDFYVEADEIGLKQPSTIIRIVDDAVEILRQGAVTIKENGEIA